MKIKINAIFFKKLTKKKKDNIPIKTGSQNY